MNCANHPDRERISFCQNCGKPLCAECSRTVGTGVFCEPCLAARLASAEAPSGYGAAPFAGQTVAGIPVSIANGGPNPILAAFLGFIPGVGAMYNGQYAKGVVHLVVFAVLVSLADHADGIFGLFVAGWEFYMAFEAYHTARARRDGTPLPNPFGLNDIGERFGFTNSWMPATGGSPVTVPFAQPAATSFAHDASRNVSYSAADRTTLTQSASGAQPYSAPGATPPPTWTAAPSYSQSFTPVPLPVQPYAPVPADTPFAPVPSLPRFPAGAIWLIVLGLFFFFGSTGILHGFPIERIFPFLLIGLGIWLFIRKMTAFGHPLQDDGTPEYRQRIFAALRGSVWVILIGILFFLDSFNILSWSRSWPLFIIVAGIMALLQRYAYAAPAASMPYPASPVPNMPPTDTAPSQEGK